MYPEGILCANEIKYAELEVPVLVIQVEYSNTASIHHMNTYTWNAHRYAKK